MTMTKMKLKVTVIIFATSRLEKIPRLAASLHFPTQFLGSLYPSEIFPSLPPLSWYLW